MILEEIRLKNFRNYENIFLKFEPGLIFLIGENGEGKTNLLEAIGFFSFMKSFRDLKETDLVKWGENYFHISGFFKSKKNVKIEIGFEKEPIAKRKVKLDGSLVKKRTDVIGEALSVVFSPADLRIIEEGPIERRRYIDSFISMSDRFYLETLQHYNKILKQRNALLRQKENNENLINIWNEQLVNKGTEIKNIRETQVAILKEKYEKNVKKISGEKDNFNLFYKPNFKNKEDFFARLKERYLRDKKLGYTSVGIHRDDIFIGIDSKDISEFGSQGQKRSTVLALKSAAFEFLKEKTGISPILLIDDVIRELDIKRRELFIRVISQAEQTFFTTTDLEGIDDFVKLFSNKQIYSVHNNEILRIG